MNVKYHMSFAVSNNDGIHFPKRTARWTNELSAERARLCLDDVLARGCYGDVNRTGNRCLLTSSFKPESTAQFM
jgi:hypothetical protein